MTNTNLDIKSFNVHLATLFLLAQATWLGSWRHDDYAVKFKELAETWNALDPQARKWTYFHAPNAASFYTLTQHQACVKVCAEHNGAGLEPLLYTLLVGPSTDAQDWAIDVLTKHGMTQDAIRELQLSVYPMMDKLDDLFDDLFKLVERDNASDAESSNAAEVTG